MKISFSWTRRYSFHLDFAFLGIGIFTWGSGQGEAGTAFSPIFV